MEQFYGKYRGTVINNIDVQQQARLLVQVPDVLGLGISSWAMPCVPFAGLQSGIFCVPIIGSKVWVEFEGGDTDRPIWCGGFWGSAAEVPVLAFAGLPTSPNIVLQTSGQNTISVSDLPGTGGILLKSATGATITINETGIIIQNGQGAVLALTGPTVTINNGAMVIT